MRVEGGGGRLGLEVGVGKNFRLSDYFKNPNGVFWNYSEWCAMFVLW